MFFPIFGRTNGVSRILIQGEKLTPRKCQRCRKITRFFVADPDENCLMLYKGNVSFDWDGEQEEKKKK